VTVASNKGAAPPDIVLKLRFDRSIRDSVEDEGVWMNVIAPDAGTADFAALAAMKELRASWDTYGDTYGSEVNVSWIL
jgi:hypothetical protein